MVTIPRHHTQFVDAVRVLVTDGFVLFRRAEPLQQQERQVGERSGLIVVLEDRRTSLYICVSRCRSHSRSRSFVTSFVGTPPVGQAVYRLRQGAGDGRVARVAGHGPDGHGGVYGPSTVGRGYLEHTVVPSRALRSSLLAPRSPLRPPLSPAHPLSFLLLNKESIRRIRRRVSVST